MPLNQVKVLGDDKNRRGVLFSAFTGIDIIKCIVSYEAMDDEERRPGASPAPDRLEQFSRLERRITEAAARKFFSGNTENGEIKVVVKTADLGAVPKGI